MWRRIARKFFGGSDDSHQKANVSVQDAWPLDTALHPGAVARKPWRTVGPTEQRLREANKESWIKSTKGWSEMLGRFSAR